MIETIDALLLAIPFVLIAAFVVQTMAATSRVAAWAAPAPVRTTKVRLTAAAPFSADMENVHQLFAGSMTLDADTDLSAAA